MDRLRIGGHVNRRGLLLSALGALPWLAGCGGGSKSGTARTRRVTVTIAPELIGPDRQVRSAYSAAQPPGADGTAQTALANSGAQLLLLTDGSGAARALSVVTAGTSAATMDVTGTALALLFLTPGVLTTDPREADSRLAALQTLAAFPAWATFLQSRLPGASLRDLRADSEAERLRTACLMEWQHRGRARGWQADFARFQADFTGGDSIELLSGAWRDAVVLRERLDSNRDVIPEPRLVTTPMEGASPNTWGRLLSAAGFTTGRRLDRPEVNADPPVGAIRYTLYGPGRADAVAIPVPLAVLDPYGNSAFFAGVLPLVDLVYGNAAALARGWSGAREALAQAVPGLDTSALRTAIRAGNADGAAGALVPCVEAALAGATTLATVFALIGPGKLPTADSPDLVRAAADGLAPSSFRLLAQTWTDYPEVSVYEVPVTSGEVIVR